MALWLWYRGTAFRGYQAQVQGPTVQQTLTPVLQKFGIEGAPSPSGRTDAGVHARMQVVSFRAPDDLHAQRLQAAINEVAPDSLGCFRAERATKVFHAQWSAVAKEYRYRLLLDSGPDDERWRAHAWRPTDHARLEGRSVRAEDVADLLAQAEGERDFGAFHENSSVRKLRRLESARLFDLGNGVTEVRLRGSGFGRYQVRYLVGSAVAVAAGILTREQWRSALETAESMPGLKAEAQGLVLWQVTYPTSVNPFLVPPDGEPDSGLPFWAREVRSATLVSR